MDEGVIEDDEKDQSYNPEQPNDDDDDDEDDIDIDAI
jgi:hypothetical protein